jgi:hypothetical protein
VFLSLFAGFRNYRIASAVVYAHGCYCHPPEKSGPAVRVLKGATHRPEFGLGRSKRTLEGGPECTDWCFGRPIWPN